MLGRRPAPRDPVIDRVHELPIRELQVLRDAVVAAEAAKSSRRPVAA